MGISFQLPGRPYNEPGEVVTRRIMPRTEYDKIADPGNRQEMAVRRPPAVVSGENGRTEPGSFLLLQHFFDLSELFLTLSGGVFGFTFGL
jgi:hypothetical protein